MNVRGTLLPLTPDGVRATRKQLGMTQERFARYLGEIMKRGQYPTAREVRRWECGERKPGPIYAPALLLAARKVEERDGSQPTGAGGPA